MTKLSLYILRDPSKKDLAVNPFVNLVNLESLKLNGNLVIFGNVILYISKLPKLSKLIFNSILVYDEDDFANFESLEIVRIDLIEKVEDVDSNVENILLKNNPNLLLLKNNSRKYKKFNVHKYCNK